MLVCFNDVHGEGVGTGARESAQQHLHLQGLRYQGAAMTVFDRLAPTGRFTLALTFGMLAGCGAEVAGTAATSAKLQATQAEQAKAQEAQFKKKLNEAMQATEAAASAAGSQ